MNQITWGLVPLIAGLALSAHAQSSARSQQANRTTMRVTKSSPQTEWLKQRLSAGGFLSNASSLNASSAGFSSKQPGGLNTRGDLDVNSESAMGLQAQIMDYPNNTEWGWFAGASIEQDREIQSLRIATPKGSGTLRFTNRPHFRPIIVSGGAAYRFNNKVYAVAGLNYTLLNNYGSGDLSSSSLDPHLGFQYGVGFRPTARVSLELIQREVNYDLSGTTGDLRISASDLKLAGLNLVARYSFQ